MENENIKDASFSEYLCPECGAPMHFDPETCKLKCDYCQGTIDIDIITSSQEFLYSEVDKNSENWDNDKIVYNCKECGAESVVSIKTISFTCPFCGSTKTLKSESIPGLKPNRVVPFKINKKQARESYIKKIKKNIFVSKKVKQDDFDITVNGIYLPSWTYDANTTTTYRGVLGRTRTRKVGKETKSYTEWFKISGTCNMGFDDVLILASNTAGGKKFESIKPFDTNHSYVFDEKYLAGYTSEHYCIDVHKGLARAQSIMNEKIKKEILSQYTYDKIQSFSMDPKYSNIRYKYVIIPLYNGLFKFNSKNYQFYVNGETGKAAGKMPLSPFRVGLAVLLGLLVVGFFIYIAVKYSEDLTTYINLLTKQFFKL